jgi:hypothetical protein
MAKGSGSPSPRRLEDYDELKRRLAEARHNIDAYRGALGHPVPGNHDGKLSDGTVPSCGLCDPVHRRAVEAERRLAACREALEVARVGMCAVAVPDAAERAVLNDAFDHVTETLNLTK